MEDAVELRIVQINVDDLAAAWSFYVEKLGLHPERPYRAGVPFRLTGPGATDIVVYPVDNISPRVYPDGTGSVLVFGTRDLPATIALWRSKNVAFIPIPGSKHPLGIAPSPVGPYIAFCDPAGNVHELLEAQPGNAP